jgi:hypothetical protein
MITIDKNTSEQSLKLHPVDDGISSLNIHSDFTDKDITIQLGSNLSLYDRYSWFLIPNDVYIMLSTGLYMYEQYLDGKQISFGMLMVVDENEFPIVPVIDTTSDDGDYNVFRD